MVRMRTLAIAAVAVAGCMQPSWGAGALLHPMRRPLRTSPALAHRDVVVNAGDGVVLRGWLFPAKGVRRRETIVYLHGVADNRESGTWIAERLAARGFDVLAYDDRAHGASGGDACTYGFYEKRDLYRVLDALGIARAVLVGVSLGAAIALQAAPNDPRVVAVVAASTFSDLETIARDRAPSLASDAQIRAAVALAEVEGKFRVAEVSPVEAARRIAVPVLLIHGTRDRETRPVHSDRVLAALAGPKRLLRVETAHDDALGRAWPDVEPWIEAVAETK
jgi:pimeloyl-ACP methyl ester carboxylesterase